MIPRVIRFLRRLFDSVLFFVRSPVSLKVEVKNQRAISLGRSVRIGYFGRLYVNDPDKGSRIEFGDHSWLGRNIEIQVSDGQIAKVGRRATLQDLCKVLGDVKIGAYSTLASNVFLSSGTHTYSATPYLNVKKQDLLYPVPSNPISVGEDTWIGNSVFVKSGVTIGRGCVIGANSVVLKNLAPYGVYGGIPARKLKDRLQFQPPRKINFQSENDRIYFYEGFDQENIGENGLEVYGNYAVMAVQAGSVSIELHSSVPGQKLAINNAVFDLIEGKNLVSIQVTPAADLPYSFVTLRKTVSFKGSLYVSSANSKQ